MSAIAKSPSKKSKLVETAGDLFYRQGYRATGVKQIIDEAGIAKGTFYSHFDSKEEIGVAWLQSLNDQWNQAMREALVNAKSPRAKILSFFTMLEDWMETNNYRGCAFLNSLAELPQPTGKMRNLIREHKAAILDNMLELAREHFVDKSKTYADQKGKVIYLLFEAALVEGQNVHDQWPTQVARKEVKAILQAKG